MPMMNVMDAVVKVMEDEGVQLAFGVPGAAILPLYQALAKSTQIKHISVRHEEGGTHAADAYARVTGKVGINIGTSGPAGTNMITGLYTCQADSIPIICITGQAPTTVLHKEAFQAVDIVEIAKPVAKWAVQVKESAQLTWTFREAFRVAQEGRPGPVLIDLPLDVQKGAEVDFDATRGGPLVWERPAPNLNAIRQAVEMILAAERPLLMPGGGVIIGDAAEQFLALAEYLQVPVSPTYMGKGSIPEDHPLFGGIVGLQTNQRYANALFLESDLVVGIGNRWAERHTGDLETYRGERKFVHIDIDARQIGRVFQPDLGIVSDAGLALEAMRRVAGEMMPAQESGGEWSERVVQLRSTLLRKMDFDDVPIKPQRVFKEVNEFFDPDTVFLTAIGLYQIFSGQFQKTYKPRHYLCCGQAGPLGWEVPGCIGAKLGKPDNLVVGVVGDYSFQFLMEEVAVAVQYKVPYVLVMLNNAYMGLIRQSELNYDINFAVDLAYDGPAGDYGIDNVAVMEAMGALGRRVTEPGDLQAALHWAVTASEERQVPALVEIMCERETNAAMGVSIAKINEYEAILNGEHEAAGEVVGAVPERD